MVLVEYPLGPAQVEVVLGIFAPGQVHHRLQVVQQHIEVGALRIQVVQLVGFLVEVFGHLIRPFLVLGLLQQLGLLGRRLAVGYLRLQVLDLLLQEVVALLLVDVLARLVADVGLQRLQVNLAVDVLHHREEALLDAVDANQADFLLDGEG